jgi:hypothetical protein
VANACSFIRSAVRSRIGGCCHGTSDPFSIKRNHLHLIVEADGPGFRLERTAALDSGATSATARNPAMSSTMGAAQLVAEAAIVSRRNPKLHRRAGAGAGAERTRERVVWIAAIQRTRSAIARVVMAAAG